LANSLNQAVAISAGNLASGGVETHVRILSLMLRRAGHGVALYGTSCHWQPESVQQLKRAEVQLLIPPRRLAARPRLGALWAAMRWRLSAPSGVASLYAIGAGRSHGLLKRLAGPKVISIYHEIVSPPGADSPAADCLRLMDGAIANSQLVARVMAANCPDKPIRVIPFLTAEETTPAPVPRPAARSRALQVGYLGRLEKRKRPDVLVQEWVRMTAGPPLAPAILHLHGDDDGSGLRGELESYVAANGLGDRVQLHGGYSHSQLPEILSKLDVVVLPSEWEGLPLVLVEAMQQGVPFVATAAGGTAELGQDNPDVIVTDTEWGAFEAGLAEMAARLRAGQVDAVRLHGWVEPRYGFASVSKQWQSALLEPKAFFGLAKC
jgi:glycosyltransferase involved in cell wall biosynthesis